jgi:hypothetical protein
VSESKDLKVDTHPPPFATKEECMSVRKKFVENAMKNWIALNEAISEMTADEVKLALEMENRRTPPRKSLVKRLEQRYHGVRSEEIRKELP